MLFKRIIYMISLNVFLFLHKWFKFASFKSLKYALKLRGIEANIAIINYMSEEEKNVL